MRCDDSTREERGAEERGSPGAPEQEYDVKVRLEAVRRLGRIRRLRIQVPLTAAGVLIALSGIAVGVSNGWFALGGFGGAFGPWVILLGVLPTQSHTIGISLASMTAIFGFAMFASALSVFVWPCDLSSAQLCTVLYVANLYAIVVLGIAALCACAIGLALANNTLGVRWLPSRPPRAALVRAWHLAGVLLLSYALAWFAFGTVGLLRSLDAVEQQRIRTGVRPAPPPLGWFVDLLVGVELLVLGSLSLWPRLRTVVQARLARMDEGVAAASAVASMLGTQRTDTIVAMARATLRSVRADQLHARLFDDHEPAANAFALSEPARLGTIDAFISHSWSDPPEPKMRLLQAWRAQFVRMHGREPKLWIDKCCINPSGLTSLLPLIPIYLSGCDSLLALRGPTYLTRLWCVIELFAFREMNADAGRFLILNFEGTQPYGLGGVALDPLGEPDNSSGSRGQQLRNAIRRNSRRSGSVGASSALQLQRFDVRRATCVGKGDKDALLAAIESCGAGFEAFNDWMHNLLVSHCSPEQALRATGLVDPSAGQCAEAASTGTKRSSFFWRSPWAPPHCMLMQPRSAAQVVPYEAPATPTRGDTPFITSHVTAVDDDE